MSDVRVVINNHIMDRIIHVTRENSGRRQADKVDIHIAGDVTGLRESMPVMVTYDKISLQHTVGLWSCERDYNDASGYANHGISNNINVVTFASGYAGQGWVFGNDDSVVTVPYNNSLDFSGQWDLSMWIKPDAVDRDQTIFYHGVSTSDRIELQITATGKLALDVDGRRHTSTLDVVAGVWQHIRVAHTSATSLQLFVGNDSYEITTRDYWDDTATDTGITYGGCGTSGTTPHGVSGTTYYAGMMDLIRLKCGDAMSDTEHALILHTNEPAEFARFGGRIQEYHGHDTHVEISALSYAADLHYKQVQYVNETEVDIIDALINIIQNNTTLHAEANDTSGIIFQAPFFDGKIIDIIQKYLEATGWTFHADPFGVVHFFQTTQRQLPHGIIHGKNATVATIGSDDEDVANQITVTGGGQTVGFTESPDDPIQSGIYTKDALNIRSKRLMLDRNRYTTTIITGHAADTETLFKDGITLLGAIKGTPTVKIGFTTENTELPDTPVTWYELALRGMHSIADVLYAFWPVRQFWTLAETTDYVLSEHRTKITLRSSYVWPTTTLNFGQYGDNTGVYRNRNDRNQYIEIAADASVKPHVLYISYHYRQVTETPQLIPHQIGYVNTELENGRDVRKSLPWIITDVDKTRYITWYLENHNKINPSIECVIPDYAAPHRIGDIVHVYRKDLITHDANGINDDYIVHSIKSEFPDNTSTLVLGEYYSDFVTSMQNISRKLQDLDTKNDEYNITYRTVDVWKIRTKHEVTITETS